MTEIPDTTLGDNWMVIVFECPISSLDKVLIDCFDGLEEIGNIAKIPHYMIRGKLSLNDVIISLRILNYPEHNEKIKRTLKQIFSGYNLEDKLQFDPHKDTSLFKFHSWLKKGQVDKRWDLARCETLNQLSLLCIFLMRRKLFLPHPPQKEAGREHVIHLLNWMLGLREFKRIYQELLLENTPPFFLGDFSTKIVEQDDIELIFKIRQSSNRTFRSKMS